MRRDVASEMVHPAPRRGAAESAAQEAGRGVVRPALPSDAAAIAELFRGTYGGSSHPCQSTDFVRASFRSDVWFVAARADLVVACTCVARHAWNGVFETCRSITRPSHRGLGLGHMLYEESLRWVTSHGGGAMTVGFPRSLAMLHLVADARERLFCVTGHDGGMNIANGRREFHLVNFTATPAAQTPRVVAPETDLVRGPLESDIASRLRLGAQAGPYPNTLVVGPRASARREIDGCVIDHEFDRRSPGRSLHITGFGDTEPSPEVAAAAIQRLLREEVGAEFAYAYVLRDKLSLVRALHRQGFAPTAFLPAWYGHRGFRYDCLLLTYNALRRATVAHETGKLIAAFDAELGALIRA